MVYAPAGWLESLPGRTLSGRYHLERLLGAGGMGAVFEGTHVAVGRKVAVKILSPHLAQSRTQVERFQQEARAAAAIGRRGVVEVLDFDRDPNAGPYLVMEFLRGESLAERMNHLLRMSPVEASKLGCELLETLSAVHERSIVHRDLKPENIFFATTEEGTEVVKILDFGLSRMRDAGRGVQLTAPGLVLGTPRFMAPEQARALPDVDQRADIYSVGVILYSVLSGSAPYRNMDGGQILQALITGPLPSLRTIAPDVPPVLCDVVDRSMAHRREDRYQNAAEFTEALRGIEDQLRTSNAPAPPGAVQTGQAHVSTEAGTFGQNPAAPPNAIAPQGPPIPPPSPPPGAAPHDPPPPAAQGAILTQPMMAVPMGTAAPPAPFAPNAAPITMPGPGSPQGPGAIAPGWHTHSAPPAPPQPGGVPMGAGSAPYGQPPMGAAPYVAPQAPQMFAPPPQVAPAAVPNRAQPSQAAIVVIAVGVFVVIALVLVWLIFLRDTAERAETSRRTPTVLQPQTPHGGTTLPTVAQPGGQTGAATPEEITLQGELEAQLAEGLAARGAGNNREARERFRAVIERARSANVTPGGGAAQAAAWADIHAAEIDTNNVSQPPSISDEAQLVPRYNAWRARHQAVHDLLVDAERLGNPEQRQCALTRRGQLSDRIARAHDQLSLRGSPMRPLSPELRGLRSHRETHWNAAREFFQAALHPELGQGRCRAEAQAGLLRVEAARNSIPSNEN